MEPTWTDLPESSQNSSEQSRYGDVLRHMHEKFQKYGDRMTTGHETTHGIHAYIRNTFAASERKNGFYCFDSKAVLVPEPNMKKSDVAAKVPEFCRKSRFEMY